MLPGHMTSTKEWEMGTGAHAGNAKKRQGIGALLEPSFEMTHSPSDLPSFLLMFMFPPSCSFLLSFLNDKKK